MIGTRPSVALRLGAHSEKEYFEKTLRFFDGIIVAANLMESTPGATSSLLVKFAGASHKLPYMIDPMTYAFGPSVYEGTDTERTDLDWIKSPQKRDGTIVRDFKRSYQRLASELGGVFEASVTRSKSVLVGDLATPESIIEMCRSVINYQTSRVRLELEKDDELRRYAGEVPEPTVVLTPYFFITEKEMDTKFQLMIDIARTSAAIKCTAPVHAVVCADRALLLNKTFSDRLAKELPGTGLKGVWLWFSSLAEEQAQLGELKALRDIVKALFDVGMQVHNLHGGFLSLCLSKYGMGCVSHGVGYGEQKNVVPVVGQATPTVRYYISDVRRRLGVPDIQRCFKALGISTVTDFHSKICDCAICRGVVSSSVSDFAQFGVMHYSTEDSKRVSQTPAAAKRCRYHFLLNRIKERDWLRDATLEEITVALKNADKIWGKLPLFSDESTHLATWASVLK